MPKVPEQVVSKEIWAILGLFTTLFSVMFGVAVYFLDQEQSTKRLEHETILNQRILNKNLLSENIKDNLKVTYYGQKVGSVNVTDSKFTNTGGQSIKKEDFETPLSLTFNETNRVIDTKIVRSNLNDFKPPLTYDDSTNKVEIGKFQFNASSFFVVRTYTISTDDSADSTLQKPKAGGYGNFEFKPEKRVGKFQ